LLVFELRLEIAESHVRLRKDTVDNDIPRKLEVFWEGGLRVEQVVLRRRYSVRNADLKAEGYPLNVAKIFF
jgi:hypothetical protein